MGDSDSQMRELVSHRFLFWGEIVIWCGLAVTLLLLGAVAWKAAELIAYVPFVLTLLGAAFLILRHPLVNIVVLLAAFVLISDYQEGIQITEVVYGLYYLSFVGYHLFSRAFLLDESIATRFEEKALLGFMLVVTLSIGVTIVFQGKLSEVVSQWTALALLLLYFPIKEFFLRDDRAPAVLFAILAWIGLFAAMRNYYVYHSMLSSADHLWQIARGRVVTNDNLLMVSSLAMLVLLVFARTWKHRFFLLPAFLVPLGGLILTQSRGFWVAFAVGAFLLLVLVGQRERIRLIGFGAAGFVVGGAVGLIFFGDSLALIVSGLVERASSLGTAGTRDVSLYNRFFESSAVWDQIVKNPILGYGIGVPYRFFDLTFMATREDTFIHNAFLSIWYRFGILGLLLLTAAWGGAILRGFQAFRTRSAPKLVRLAGLTCAVALGAYVLPANTSNPFYLNDSLYLFGILMGMAGGAAACAQRSRDAHDMPVVP